MSDKEQRRRYPAMAAFYAQHLHILTRRAREHGYALAVHGSMATDLDLVAIPWTDEAIEAGALVETIRELVDGYIPIANDPAFPNLEGNPAHRPHGRLAWSIYLNPEGFGPYIDLSVMPRQTVERAAQEEPTPALNTLDEPGPDAKEGL